MCHHEDYKVDWPKARPIARSPNNPYPRIYLRCVDPGTDNECWVVCAKGDHGAVPFLREDGMD